MSKTPRSNLKVMTIVGTRPEIIRLSRIIAVLDDFLEQILVHTGQNYDYELNQIFFEDLEIRKPDHFLEVEVSSLGAVIGNTISRIEPLLRSEKPNAVLILGDTNSSLASIMAKRLRIPIYHMEAGNRCFDLNVPEEINRRIVDHIADFNLVYTEHARRHLISEGLPHRRIYLSGSPMGEVLEYYTEKIGKSGALVEMRLVDKKYFVVSVHREENVDNPSNLRICIEVLKRLVEEFDLPIIVSTHPRTCKRLESLGIDQVSQKVRFMKPFGFTDYVHLQKHAFCTISDSGTISEESAILSFPAVTLRNAMERPEALDSGTIVLTGLNADRVLDAVHFVTSHPQGLENRRIPAEYLVKDVSSRVLQLIVGTCQLSNAWSGIAFNPLHNIDN